MPFNYHYYECFFTYITCFVIITVSNSFINKKKKKKKTFVQCCTNVSDAGTTLYICATNVLCLLGPYVGPTTNHNNGKHRVQNHIGSTSRGCCVGGFGCCCPALILARTARWPVGQQPLFRSKFPHFTPTRRRPEQDVTSRLPMWFFSTVRFSLDARWSYQQSLNSIVLGDPLTAPSDPKGPLN